MTVLSNRQHQQSRNQGHCHGNQNQGQIRIHINGLSGPLQMPLSTRFLNLGAPNRKWNGNLLGPKRLKDGLPDMRFSCNYSLDHECSNECFKIKNLTTETLQVYIFAAGTVMRQWNQNILGPKRKDGLPDMRYKCNRTQNHICTHQCDNIDTNLYNAIIQMFANAGSLQYYWSGNIAGPKRKSDYLPDMRYNLNRIKKMIPRINSIKEEPNEHQKHKEKEIRIKKTKDKKKNRDRKKHMRKQHLVKKKGNRRSHRKYGKERKSGKKNKHC